MHILDVLTATPIPHFGRRVRYVRYDTNINIIFCQILSERGQNETSPFPRTTTTGSVPVYQYTVYQAAIYVRRYVADDGNGPCWLFLNYSHWSGTRFITGNEWCGTRCNPSMIITTSNDWDIVLQIYHTGNRGINNITCYSYNDILYIALDVDVLHLETACEFAKLHLKC